MKRRLHPFAFLGIGIFVMALLLTLLFAMVSYQVDQAGGVKQILIDVGKDAKDVINEVQKHEINE